MKSLKFANAALCEHVIRGEGHKFSLINLYTGDVLVGHFPANLLLGVYAEYVPVDVGPITVSLEIRVNKKSAGRLDSEIDVRQANAPVPLVVRSMSLKLSGPSVLEVVGTSSDYKSKTIIKKKIIAGNIPD